MGVCDHAGLQWVSLVEQSNVADVLAILGDNDTFTRPKANR